jgi:hypothetical protein
MRVLCISNSGADLPEDCLNQSLGFTADTDFALIPGKTYTVYGFTLFLGYVWYYLCDEDFSYYPIWSPAPLFEIVDHRLSSYWEFYYRFGPSVGDANLIVSFPEWTSDPLYYDKLTNGEREAVDIFCHYKKLIDDEYWEA